MALRLKVSRHLNFIPYILYILYIYTNKFETQGHTHQSLIFIDRTIIGSRIIIRNRSKDIYYRHTVYIYASSYHFNMFHYCLIFDIYHIHIHIYIMYNITF